MVQGGAVANDEFGWSVHARGNTSIVSAHRHAVNGPQSGAAYVYIRDNNQWTQQAMLSPTDGTTQDWFGYSVAVDGNTAIVGAVFADIAGNLMHGAVYIFVRTGQTWTQQAKIIPPANRQGSLYGWSVAIEGDTAVVGAPFYHATYQYQGRVFVYQRLNNVWSLAADLTAPDGEQTDYLGTCVAIDNGTLVATAPFAVNQSGSATGAAYVYTKPAATWTEQARLSPTENDAGAQMGLAAALDSDTAVFGAPYTTTATGSCYVFHRSSGIWTQSARLTASDGIEDDRFGQGVDMSGPLLVVGANGTGTWQGSAYLFSNCSGPWTEFARIDASESEPSDYYAEAVTTNGHQVIASAHRKAGSAGAGQGRVYSYEVQMLPHSEMLVGPSMTELCSATIVSLNVQPSEIGMEYAVQVDGTDAGVSVPGNGADIVVSGQVTSPIAKNASLSVRATNPISSCSVTLQYVQTVWIWPNGDAGQPVSGADIQSFLDSLLNNATPGEVYCHFDFTGDGVVSNADIDAFVASALNQ
ncbi:MAG: hypothetical protein HZA51_17575 [Planctomycetes bacterium]|nr:hypothetical protein [Planctomycetota bacterium]